MKKIYFLAGIIGSCFLLVSNSTNPPDRHTGAPGELFCANCHSSNGSSITGTITVEGFPTSITPEETYLLTVVNRNTNGGAVKAGFQITILGPTNTIAGLMSSPSDSSQLSMLSGRQYFEHHPSAIYPDSAVVKWTVLWTAPAIADGSIVTWYANGIIGNGNSKSTGDKTASNKGSGTIILAATQNITNTKPLIYPNPGSDVIHISFPEPTDDMIYVTFCDLNGRIVDSEELQNGILNVPNLPSGLYLIEIKNNKHSYVARWSKI
ncbi:MAG: T9SS type A sorting domain-containing protein [Saprospiraceae bacterium]